MEIGEQVTQAVNLEMGDHMARLESRCDKLMNDLASRCIRVEEDTLSHMVISRPRDDRRGD